MKGLNDDLCTKCGKRLRYHERHYITETQHENVSVWCDFCFKLEMIKRTGKHLKITDYNQEK